MRYVSKRDFPLLPCSYNIWHTWNEGLMGAFQTLREQGALPLVQIDGDGNMRWVGEWVGGW